MNEINKINEIKFKSLNYSVKCGLFHPKTKEILRNINGRFQGQKLCAIIGNEKTSLLNALSGFQKRGIAGEIKVNEKDLSECKNQIAYISLETNSNKQQQQLLTVEESLKFSMRLKLRVNTQQRRLKLMRLIQLIKLEGHERTLVKYLTEVQRRQLTIALEIVDSPKIIFVDALNGSSSIECVKLLKQLVLDGNRTVICAVDQPSAFVAEMFDDLYALANGKCIYHGNFKKILKFLTEINLQCPSTYNPLDYLMEVADDESKCESLAEKIQNGMNEEYSNGDDGDKVVTAAVAEDDLQATASFCNQFMYLMQRNIVIMKRDRTYIYFRLFAHLFLGLLVGLLFSNVRDDALNVFKHFRLIIGILIILLYSSVYSQITMFPLNYSVIKRECFNRWYTTKIFNMALLIVDAPVTVASVLLFIIPTYIMTNQPLELFRFAAFLLILLLSSFNSQNIGLLASCTPSVLSALIISPFLLVYFLIFSGTFIIARDTQPFLRPLFKTTFLSYATDGLELAVLGFNRSELSCPEIYCFFQKPEKFLQIIESSGNFGEIVIILLTYMIVFRLIVMIIMSYQIKMK